MSKALNKAQYLTEDECYQKIDSLLGRGEGMVSRQEIMNHYLDLILSGREHEIPNLEPAVDSNDRSTIYLTEVDLISKKEQLLDVVTQNNIVVISATDVIGNPEKFIRLYDIEKFFESVEGSTYITHYDYNYLDSKTHSAVLTLIKKEAS